MTNREVFNKIFDVDIDSTKLTITCDMLMCSKCPHRDDNDCTPYIDDKDITNEWLEMEWR